MAIEIIAIFPKYNVSYYKIIFLYNIGKCLTLQGYFEKGLNSLKESLKIEEDWFKNSNINIVDCLYHISWNLLISGNLNDAYNYINRAIDLSLSFV